MNIFDNVLADWQRCRFLTNHVVAYEGWGGQVFDIQGMEYDLNARAGKGLILEGKEKSKCTTGASVLQAARCCAAFWGPCRGRMFGLQRLR